MCLGCGKTKLNLWYANYNFKLRFTSGNAGIPVKSRNLSNLEVDGEWHPLFWYKTVSSTSKVFHAEGEN